MAADAPLFGPDVGGNDLIAQLQTYLALAVMHLAKAPPPSLKTTVLADLTAVEADYTGYAAKTLTAWTGPFNTSLGGSSILSPLASFSPTGTTISNTIYGGWIESAGGVLELIFTLSTPVGLGSATDVLSLVAEFMLPGYGVIHQLD